MEGLGSFIGEGTTPLQVFLPLRHDFDHLACKCDQIVRLKRCNYRLALLCVRENRQPECVERADRSAHAQARKPVQNSLAASSQEVVEIAILPKERPRSLSSERFFEPFKLVGR